MSTRPTSAQSSRPHPTGNIGAPGVYAGALAAVFSAWRRLLSPVFVASGLGHCRYLPSCSEYAHVALARHGPVRGTALALARLARCHPWAAGGLDPVPPVTSHHRPIHRDDR